MLRLLAIPCLALCLLVTCGTAVVGQLAPADQTAAAEPPIPAPATHPVDIQAGSLHTCMLTDGGDVRCWGVTDYTAGGYATPRPTNVPLPIAGLGKGIVALGVGSYSGCAVTSEGAARCWGFNGLGQLGDGTTTDRLVAVDVVGLGSGVKSVAAGSGHSCAVLQDGGVKCWGNNSNGQLGDGTTTDRLIAVAVVGLAGNVASVAVWGTFSCALMTDGGVQCWGGNSGGQLGDGTKEDRITPVAVQGLPGNATSLRSGWWTTCALIGDDPASRQAWCWGGPAGPTPNDHFKLGEGVTDLSLGTSFSCAIIRGAAKCWGDVYPPGGLGDGTYEPSQTPVSVAGMESNVTAIAVGWMHACAIRDDQAYCWGNGELGRMGDGSWLRRRTPQLVNTLAGGATVDGGATHTCALASGGVKCWGSNYYGQLGSDSLVPHFAPEDAKGLTSGVTALAVGGYHNCAIKGGKLFCWGSNFNGQIGDDTYGNVRWAAIETGHFSSRVLAVTAGGFHTCALIEAAAGQGAVQCWGLNDAGQLGDGTQVTRSTPAPVTGLGADIVALSAGYYHTCALRKSGSVLCWGGIGVGRPPRATESGPYLMPTQVVGLEKDIAAIASGFAHACALTRGGGMKCWGYNSVGQLGNGSATLTDQVVDVLGLDSGVQAMSLGMLHTCALLTGGAVRCWGLTDNYQVGDGTDIGQRWNPVEPVGLGSGVVSVGAGNYFTCAADGSGVRCWGENLYGQLGWNPGISPVPVFWSQPSWSYFPQLAKQ